MGSWVNHNLKLRTIAQQGPYSFSLWSDGVAVDDREVRLREGRNPGFLASFCATGNNTKNGGNTTCIAQAKSRVADNLLVTRCPTDAPSSSPSAAATKSPTIAPTKAPTEKPTTKPTTKATTAPTDEPEIDWPLDIEEDVIEPSKKAMGEDFDSAA